MCLIISIFLLIDSEYYELHFHYPHLEIKISKVFKLKEKNKFIDVVIGNFIDREIKHIDYRMEKF